jgi:hypothetical protein
MMHPEKCNTPLAPIRVPVMHAIILVISVFTVLQIPFALDAGNDQPAALHTPVMAAGTGALDSTGTASFDSLWTFKAGG